MSLKKYDELNDNEKKLVQVMFSDQSTVGQYLYNFADDGKYIGRQYVPPEGNTTTGASYGTIYREEKVDKSEDTEPVKAKTKKKK